MSFVSIKEIVPRRAGGGRPGMNAGTKVTLGTHIQKNQGKGDTARSTIRIPASILKELGWVISDGVELFFSEESDLIKIERRPESSATHTISNAGTKDAEYQAGLLGFQWSPGLPSIERATPCEHSVVDGALLLRVPAETQWRTCARRIMSKSADNRAREMSNYVAYREQEARP